MIEVYKYHPDAKIPTRTYKTDAGLDLYNLTDVNVSLSSTATIDTGISVHIPEGFVGLIRDRSSLASRGLSVGGGVIDAGYNGSIKVVLHNLTCGDSYFDMHHGVHIKAGSKIAQLIIIPIDTTDLIETKFIWNSHRGTNSFGSSGT